MAPNIAEFGGFGAFFLVRRGCLFTRKRPPMSPGHVPRTRLLLVFTACLCIAAEAPGSGTAPGVGGISVVAVRTFGRDGKPSSQGTAFFTSCNGDLCTNRHLFESAFRAEIEAGQSRVFPVDGVVGEDLDGDLILLHAAVAHESIRPLALSGVGPRIGEAVTVRVGGALSSGGTVSAVNLVPPFGPVLATTAPISPTASGSPVVNAMGEVVGVATSLLIGGESVEATVPAARVTAMQVAEAKTIAQWQSTRAEYSEKPPERDYRNGLWLAWAGKYAAATGSLNETVLRDPTHARAYALLSYCFEKLDKPQEQSQAIQQLIRISPREVTNYLDLARVYGKNGYYKEVLQILDLALKVKSDCADIYTLRCWAHTQLGNCEDAVRCCKQAMTFKADDDRALYNLGLAYRKLGQREQALSAFKQALNINPKSVDAMLSSGALCLDLDRPSTAVDYLRLSVRADSANVAAWKLLGRAYTAFADSLPDAVGSLRTAVRLAPRDNEAHYLLGIAYVKIGDLPAARDELSALEGLDPTRASQLRVLIAQQPLPSRIRASRR